MLKLDIIAMALAIWAQPPSGGCVLKHSLRTNFLKRHFQPPSGGCVLKQSADLKKSVQDKPAAFGRLCVETIHTRKIVGMLFKTSRLRAAVC